MALWCKAESEFVLDELERWEVSKITAKSPMLAERHIPQQHIHQEPHSVTDLYMPSCGQRCGLLCVGWVCKCCTNTAAEACKWIFITELLCALAVILANGQGGGGLPSPARVWRWGEVNWAVRTAVNVNLVKANKVEGMKSGSQLIHSFMSVGSFHLIDLIHNECPHTHKCYWDPITLEKASVTVLLSNIFLRIILSTGV